MLKMAQQQYIKHLYEVEEKSLNEIHKITGFNYRTVRQYAYKEDWNEENLPDVEPESYPVLGEFIPVIDKWLTEDRKIPRKQRHTSKRIYERLRDELGFTGFTGIEGQGQIFDVGVCSFQIVSSFGFELSSGLQNKTAFGKHNMD